MNLNLYNKKMERVAAIGDHFVSCLWVEEYNSNGNFSLELNATKEYLEKIKTDFFVGRSDRKTIMVIKSVMYKDGKIIAAGSQATQILDDVGFVGTIDLGVNIDTAIKNAYNDSNKFDFLVIDDGNVNEVTNQEIKAGQLGEIAKNFCVSTDTGIKAIREGKKIHIIFYKPEKKENLIFSEKYGNVKINSVLSSTIGYKNFAVCIYKTKDDIEKVIELDRTNGEEKRVLIVDASSIGWEESDTTESYEEKVKVFASGELDNCKKIVDCEFSPYAKGFGTEYDIGDILTVVEHEKSFKIQSRVVRFTQKAQNNRTTTSIDIGEIIFKR